MALVGAMTGERRVSHTAGFPLDPAKMLPMADVLLLVADSDPGVMLFRYTAHGDFGGDTWHGTATEAYAQAAHEYADALGPWIEVPSGVSDAHAFAVRYAAERMNDRGNW